MAVHIQDMLKAVGEEELQKLFESNFPLFNSAQMEYTVNSSKTFCRIWQTLSPVYRAVMNSENNSGGMYG